MLCRLYHFIAFLIADWLGFICLCMAFPSLFGGFIIGGLSQISASLLSLYDWLPLSHIGKSPNDFKKHASPFLSQSMALDKFVLGAVALAVWLLYSYVLYPFYLSPFSKVPGPKLAAMTPWWIRCVDFGGKRSATIDALHRKYGKIVRVGPNELSFTGAEAMQKIYGAGSAFYKPRYFYNIFIAYFLRIRSSFQVWMSTVIRSIG